MLLYIYNNICVYNKTKYCYHYQNPALCRLIGAFSLNLSIYHDIICRDSSKNLKIFRERCHVLCVET